VFAVPEVTRVSPRYGGTQPCPHHGAPLAKEMIFTGAPGERAGGEAHGR
jgi:hypothetical protein